MLSYNMNWAAVKESRDILWVHPCSIFYSSMLCSAFKNLSAEYSMCMSQDSSTVDSVLSLGKATVASCPY